MPGGLPGGSRAVAWRVDVYARAPGHLRHEPCAWGMLVHDVVGGRLVSRTGRGDSIEWPSTVVALRARLQVSTIGVQVTAGPDSRCNVGCQGRRGSGRRLQTPVVVSPVVLLAPSTGALARGSDRPRRLIHAARIPEATPAVAIPCGHPGSPQKGQFEALTMNPKNAAQRKKNRPQTSPSRRRRCPSRPGVVAPRADSDTVTDSSECIRASLLTHSRSRARPPACRPHDGAQSPRRWTVVPRR